MKEQIEIRVLNNTFYLNDAFNLRKEVFVKEQNVPLELEIDKLDNKATTLHIGLYVDDKIAGVGRILDIDSEVIHFGRVAIGKNFRGLGLGHVLILEMEKVALNYAKKSLLCELSSQLHAEKFYASLGYVRVNNNVYIDAGIEHIDLKKHLNY